MPKVTYQTDQGPKVINFASTPSPKDINDVVTKQGWKPAVAAGVLPKKPSPAMSTTPPRDVFKKSQQTQEMTGGLSSYSPIEGVKSTTPQSISGPLPSTFSAIGKTAENLVSGEKILADAMTAGKATNSKEVNDLIESQSAGGDMNIKLIKAIRDNTKKGKDTSRLVHQLNQNFSTPDVSINDIVPGSSLSYKQVLGGALQTFADVATAGEYSGIKAGAGAFKLAKPAVAVAKESIAAGKTAGQVVKSYAPTVAKQAGIGYGLDVSANLQQGKEGKEAITPGLGTILGAAVPAATGFKAAKAVKSIEEAPDLVRRITQGKTQDIPKAIEAFSNIDLKGIKKSDELVTRLEETNKKMVQAQDLLLEQDKNLYKPSELTTVKSVNGENVGHNYIDDALTQLKNFYAETNPFEEVRIEQLQAKTKDGLTAKEVNDIAREYGREFSQKSFKIAGDRKAGITSDMAENTRMGVKEASRSLFKNPAVKTLDNKITNSIATKELVDKFSESVKKAEAKARQTGIISKIAAKGIDLADTLLGGSLKAITRRLVTERPGSMSAVELEAELEKNLKKLDKINNLKGTQFNKEFDKWVSEQAADIKEEKRFKPAGLLPEGKNSLPEGAPIEMPKTTETANEAKDVARAERQSVATKIREVGTKEPARPQLPPGRGAADIPIEMQAKGKSTIYPTEKMPAKSKIKTTKRYPRNKK